MATVLCVGVVFLSDDWWVEFHSWWHFDDESGDPFSQLWREK